MNDDPNLNNNNNLENGADRPRPEIIPSNDPNILESYRIGDMVFDVPTPGATQDFGQVEPQPVVESQPAVSEVVETPVNENVVGLDDAEITRQINLANAGLTPDHDMLQASEIAKQFEQNGPNEFERELDRQESMTPFVAQPVNEAAPTEDISPVEPVVATENPAPAQETVEEVRAEAPAVETPVVETTPTSSLTEEEQKELESLREELDNADYNDMYLNPDVYREKQERLEALENGTTSANGPLTEDEIREMESLREELNNADYNDMYLNPDYYREKQDRLAELERRSNIAVSTFEPRQVAPEAPAAVAEPATPVVPEPVASFEPSVPVEETPSVVQETPVNEVQDVERVVTPIPSFVPENVVPEPTVAPQAVTPQEPKLEQVNPQVVTPVQNAVEPQQEVVNNAPVTPIIPNQNVGAPEVEGPAIKYDRVKGPLGDWLKPDVDMNQRPLASQSYAQAAAGPVSGNNPVTPEKQEVAQNLVDTLNKVVEKQTEGTPVVIPGPTIEEQVAQDEIKRTTNFDYATGTLSHDMKQASESAAVIAAELDRQDQAAIDEAMRETKITQDINLANAGLVPDHDMYQASKSAEFFEQQLEEKEAPKAVIMGRQLLERDDLEKADWLVDYQKEIEETQNKKEAVIAPLVGGEQDPKAKQEEEKEKEDKLIPVVVYKKAKETLLDKLKKNKNVIKIVAAVAMLIAIAHGCSTIAKNPIDNKPTDEVEKPAVEEVIQTPTPTPTPAPQSTIPPVGGQTDTGTTNPDTTDDNKKTEEENKTPEEEKKDVVEEKKTPEEEKKTDEDEKKIDEEEKKTPEEEKKTPEEEKKTPEEEKKTPEDPTPEAPTPEAPIPEGPTTTITDPTEAEVVPGYEIVNDEETIFKLRTEDEIPGGKYVTTDSEGHDLTGQNVLAPGLAPQIDDDGNLIVNPTGEFVQTFGDDVDVRTASFDELDAAASVITDSEGKVFVGSNDDGFDYAGKVETMGETVLPDGTTATILDAADDVLVNGESALDGALKAATSAAAADIDAINTAGAVANIEEAKEEVVEDVKEDVANVEAQPVVDEKVEEVEVPAAEVEEVKEETVVPAGALDAALKGAPSGEELAQMLVDQMANVPTDDNIKGLGM